MVFLFLFGVIIKELHNILKAGDIIGRDCKSDTTVNVLNKLMYLRSIYWINFVDREEGYTSSLIFE